MPDISAPNAGAYGIWGPQYAAALAAQSGSPVAGPLNMLAMASRARQEQGGYSQDLMATQQRQLEMAEAANQARLQEQMIQQLVPAAAAGATRYIAPVAQSFGIQPNAQAGGAIDDAQLQETMAGVFNNRASGLASVAEIGRAPPIEQINDVLMPPDPTAPQPEYVPYMTPANTAAAQNADSNTMNAQSRRIEANRPPSSGGGREQTVDVREEINPRTGAIERVITRRGLTPEQAAALQPPRGNSVELNGGAVPSSQREQRLRESIAAALAGARQ